MRMTDGVFYSVFSPTQWRSRRKLKHDRTLPMQPKTSCALSAPGLAGSQRHNLNDTFFVAPLKKKPKILSIPALNYCTPNLTVVSDPFFLDRLPFF